MQKVKYINPIGKEMNINFNPPYVFEKIEGISSGDTNFITSQGVGQYGKTFHAARVSDRQVTVYFNIKGEDRREMYENRRKAIAVTSSSLNANGELGRLEYTNDYGSWYIKCAVKKGVDPDDRKGNYNHAKVVFYCPSPFWRSMTTETARLAWFDGGFEFPLEIDIENKVDFGKRGYQNTIYNNGDSPAPIVIEIKGTATEPRVTKISTGEYIALKKELTEGDILTINTDPDECSVIISHSDGTSESAFGYLDLNSAFFQVDPGENPLEYDSGDETTATLITTQNYSLYGGI